MFILVVNAGSSSLKYQLFNMKTKEVMAKGICERIGGDDSFLTHQVGDGDKVKTPMAMKNHSEAMKHVVEALTSPETGCISSMDEISAVGHRIVHGGEYLTKSVLVNEDTLAKLELCRDIAPLHTGPHLMGIHGCIDIMPNTPQVLVIDTAFHQTMPPEAYFYPIPYELYEKYKIRRYGFHGTSHRYVSGIAAGLLGKKPEDTKIITCHLGNGSSISAVCGGKVIDTSMGFTPLDGVMMGTRCGSIDPAIVPFIMAKENLSPSEMNDFMNKKCGFLGVSQLSSDLRDIEKAANAGHEKALLAQSILSYQIKKYIGAYTAAMNGLDAVVFTAGVGENNPNIREGSMTGMDYYGIDFNFELNKKVVRQPNIVELSTPKSKVKVYVIPTNEELVIATDTEEIINKLNK